jgi:hypothetical protein
MKTNGENMNIKEHFSRMLITLGWASTAATIIFGVYWIYKITSFASGV